MELRQHVGQEGGTKVVARGQNWEEYKNFWGFSANPYTDTPPIATSTAPRNTPAVLLSPRIYIPVRSPTRSLVQKVQIEVIKLGNVARSKPTGSPPSAHRQPTHHN